MDEKKIAVLIPCYNEEMTIEKVVRDFRAALPESYIYVYNNNSKDRTAEIVQNLMKEDPKLFLGNEYKQGKGNVVRTMFREIEADVYLMTDGDDSCPADNAREMVDIILSGKADMVNGDRLSATYFERNTRAFHGFGNRLVRDLINHIFKCNVKDIMTGYRAFNRSFVKGFPVLSRGFEVETEMTIHAVDKNFSFVDVPIIFRERPEGSVSSMNTFRDGYRILKMLFSMVLENKPFTFFGLLSVLFLMASVGVLLPVLLSLFATGMLPNFPPISLAIVFGLISLTSFFTGAILSVIVKKDRERYELVYSNLMYGEQDMEM